MPLIGFAKPGSGAPAAMREKTPVAAADENNPLRIKMLKKKAQCKRTLHFLRRFCCAASIAAAFAALGSAACEDALQRRMPLLR
jgi:hypothetical protein